MIPKILVYHGKEISLIELSKLCGKSKEILRYRMNHGMTVEQAAEKPLRRAKKKVDRPCGVDDWHECLKCRFPKGCISLSSPAMPGEGASDYWYRDYDE